MRIIKICSLLLLVSVSHNSAASEPDLSGLWYETMNFPAASVMKLERSGDFWNGTYTQVSAIQQKWGFVAGETVIKGRLKGNEFIGAVILKYPESAIKKCKIDGVGWAEIRMHLTEDSKLYGKWLQTRVRTDQDCRKEVVGWQLYGLERIKTQ